ncbi:hypothetical protein A9Q99_10050 [Gammaproteobacteria bacterium 45_16_T64]|nr:hypothetical protein A9Q99_10050 [Gammaproteobacteria bacterium 45_16_T64]
MKQFTVQALVIAVSSVVYLTACGVGPQESVDSIPLAGGNETEVNEKPIKYAKNTLKDRDRRITHPQTKEMEESVLVSAERIDQFSDDATSAAVLGRGVLPAPGKMEKKLVRAKSKIAVSQLSSVMPYQSVIIATEDVDRENYQSIASNPVHLVVENPVSTFSIDVDTGSYSNVRRFINGGRLPQKNAVRVEELVNYFNYDYPQPDSKESPFLITTEVAPSPWNNTSQLLHIGIKGYDIDRTALPNANLVFLVDVSGSMNSPQKLGLLKQSLKLITQKMRPEDRISIVVYAGASGVVLEGMSGSDKAKINHAIDQFQAGGSTNGGAGIKLAYQLAENYFIDGGINRVLLATDGDFNVGAVNFEALIDMVEKRRKTGISLTTLGFGQGNYNDQLMEQLADKGNGNYAYIDTLQEARKVLVEQMSSTLFTIAKDVKIQVEFNPTVVQEYRLIGYENRALKREDFNNDKIDAGEVGAGHSVTALYEITLKGRTGNLIDPLRYADNRGHEVKGTSLANEAELAFVKLRYKKPGQHTSQLMTKPVAMAAMNESFDNASDRFKFSAAVAGFGQILSGGKYTQSLTLEGVEKMGVASKGMDKWGYRSEFVNLVRLASALDSKG